MIALVLGSHWRQFYASSPFRNLLESSHPGFVLFTTREPEGGQPRRFTDAHAREQIARCRAVVSDGPSLELLSFYAHAPKFLVCGDPHAVDEEGARRLEAEYAACDYVLTGALFSPKRGDYRYPTDASRRKHVWCPHSVPDVGPVGPAWSDRETRALLSGNTSPIYQYRARCRELAMAGYPIDVLPPMRLVGGEYFTAVAGYRMAITDQSVFKYIVAKYFEIPWLGTLLLSPPIQREAQELVGFEHEKNVVWVEHPEGLSEVIHAVNGDPERFAAIAECGAELMQRHTASRRLDYLSALVDAVVSGGFRPDDALQLFKDMSHGQ